MYKIIVLVAFCLSITASYAQKKSIATIKAEMEKSTNSPLYVKDVLKKKFVLDTVSVVRIGHFSGLPDSIAYTGKIGKVYGPYDNGKILVQVLAKIPNTFNKVSQIFIDTSVYTYRKADSLAIDIMVKIKDKRATFEELAQLWSMGGESYTFGDLGWIASGALLPEMEKGLRNHKPGEVFKIWSKTGVHILKKTAPSKQATGFALMMRVFL